MNGSGPALRLSVIVPVYNDAHALRRCLAALIASRPPATEIIVVDDASTDESPAAAAEFDVRVLRLSANAGPAAARNHGARHARGAVLMFVDSDVLIAPGALEQATALLEARPDLAAVFGSYDAKPAATGIVSRYKNLLHHFVHQHGETEASTFWAGCGAIRRHIFEEAGGFDHERFARPSIEDIELGYRLRRAGHRIVLDKTLQGTHLKRWTLGSLVWTDVTGRAIPWARLMLERGERTDDLNVRHDQRVSAILVGLGTLCLVGAVFQPVLAVAGGVALAAVIGLNWRLYRFFARHGGVGFAAACVMLHWLYYLYSGLAFLGVWVDARLRRTSSRAAGATRAA
jgi:glycosyltransferase involved in cell wall biosynthesis